MTFNTAFISKPGGRKTNEDYCGFTSKGRYVCWVVADGLGGHSGGEVASKVAVESTHKAFRAEPTVTAAGLMRYFNVAHQQLIHEQKAIPDLLDMRTTLVLVVADGQKILWGHIGDSRLYFLRHGRIIFQTRDHSVPQAMVNAGQISLADIRHHEDRNRLLRVLGMEGELRPTVEKEPYLLQRSDAVLLCTDGFWEYISETEMEVDYLKSSNPEEWLHRMEVRLKARVSCNNDNYTAIAIFVE